MDRDLSIMTLPSHSMVCNQFLSELHRETIWNLIPLQQNMRQENEMSKVVLLKTIKGTFFFSFRSSFSLSLSHWLISVIKNSTGKI
jgi:hypothetical protein